MTVADLIQYLQEQNPQADVVFFTDERAYWLRDIEPDDDSAEQPLVILHLDSASDWDESHIPEQPTDAELREQAAAEAEHYAELLRNWNH